MGGGLALLFPWLGAHRLPSGVLRLLAPLVRRRRRMRTFQGFFLIFLVVLERRAE